MLDIPLKCMRITRDRDSELLHYTASVNSHARMHTKAHDPDGSSGMHVSDPTGLVLYRIRPTGCFL